MKKIVLLMLTVISSFGLFGQSNGLSFDGSTSTASADRVSTQYPGIADSNARTIEMWIKRGSYLTAQGIFCEMGATTGAGNRFTVKVQNNHFRVETGGSSYFLEGTTSLSASTWYHVAVVVDPALPLSQRVTMYINGNVEAQGYLFMSTDTTNMQTLQIGSRGNGVGAFNGAIDEFRVWDVPRSQSEIQVNMNTQFCILPSGLVSYFQLNEGIAGGTNTGISTVLDVVNPSNVNTLMNFSLTGTSSNFVTGNVNDNSDLTVQTVTSCTDYTWGENNQMYTASGTYEVIYTNINGCDSIVRLDLTIPVLNNGVVDNMNGTLTASMAGVSYQWLDCDNGDAPISGENAQVLIAANSGNYAVEIEDSGCKDTSVCVAVTVTPASVNPAMDFDGVDDMIQTQFAGISGNAARTIEAWIKVPSDNTTSQHTILDWGYTATGTRFTTNILNHKLRLEVAGNGINATTLLNDDIWHHIAVTYDPADDDTVRLYVDGIQEIAAKLTVPVNTGIVYDVTIGTRVDQANFFYGGMDEVRMWNVARSATEINSLKNMSVCSVDPNLVSYFSFNEGTPYANNTAIATLKDYAAYTINSVPTDFTFDGTNSNFILGPSLPAGMDFTLLTQTECSSYTWPATTQNYTTSGQYTHTVTSVNGCDSVLVLDLTINQPTAVSMTLTACESYTINNQTYTSSGVYTQMFQNAVGCDSTLTLNITIVQPSTGVDVQTACSSYTWIDGITYNSSNNTATHTISGGSMYGCDSIVTLNLTINLPSTGTDMQTACDSYMWIDGNTYTASNNTATYTIVGGSANGCDSVVTLNLTINTSPVVQVVDNGDGSLSADLTGVTYQWYDCAGNQQITGENMVSYSPTSNGDYAVIVSDGLCADTSDCFLISDLHVSNLNLTNMEAYPNPFTDMIFVHFDQSVSGTVLVQDLKGSVIYQGQIQNKSNVTVDLNVPAGVYLLSVRSNDFNKTIRVIKEVR